MSNRSSEAVEKLTDEQRKNYGFVRLVTLESIHKLIKEALDEKE